MAYKTQKSSNIQNVRRKIKCKSGFKTSQALEPNAMQNFHSGAYFLLQYHFKMSLFITIAQISPNTSLVKKQAHSCNHAMLRNTNKPVLIQFCSLKHMDH